MYPKSEPFADNTGGTITAETNLPNKQEAPSTHNQLPQEPVVPQEKGNHKLIQYVLVYWKDYVSMLLLGILGIVLYLIPPVPHRYFPLLFSDGDIVYPEFAYPLLPNLVPIWLATLLAFLLPAIVFAVTQLRYRSIQDFHAAILGLLYSLVTGAVFQMFIKRLIGGLRPHFYAACQPNVTPSTLAQVGTGYQGVMVDRSVCTGDPKEINDSLESFPSGHATAAFAGFVFCFLYINAHYKVLSDHRPEYLRFALLFAPLLAATLIAGSLTIDEFHHWYDVVGGGVIGTMMALAAYRAHYAAFWDYRYNDQVLPNRSSGMNCVERGGAGNNVHHV